MKAAITILVALFLTACSEPPPPPPVVEVVVEDVVLEPYQPKSRYVGRLQAKDDVDIQPKITGYLLSRNFADGALVKAGDVLYTLESGEYKAALAHAKAELAAAKANGANAQRNYKRGQDLLPRGAISASEMDRLTATKLDAEARIEAGLAQVASAEVNLDSTTIRAPISGRIGNSTASPGNLVGPNSGRLTTLVSIDPIEAQFQVSEATYLASVSNELLRKTSIAELRNIEVSLELTNGVLYPDVGTIEFYDNRIDPNTGTLGVRASIPNPHSILVPGQYVRVILRDTNLLEGLFISQAAVQADQQGSFVLVVDAGSMVVRRNVELGERMAEKVLVLKGVEEGERVIVRGLQLVRAGMPVKVKTLPAPAS